MNINHNQKIKIYDSIVIFNRINTKINTKPINSEEICEINTKQKKAFTYNRKISGDLKLEVNKTENLVSIQQQSTIPRRNTVREWFVYTFKLQ